MSAFLLCALGGCGIMCSCCEKKNFKEGVSAPNDSCEESSFSVDIPHVLCYREQQGRLKVVSETFSVLVAIVLCKKT